MHDCPKCFAPCKCDNMEIYLPGRDAPGDCVHICGFDEPTCCCCGCTESAPCVDGCGWHELDLETNVGVCTNCNPEPDEEELL